MDLCWYAIHSGNMRQKRRDPESGGGNDREYLCTVFVCVSVRDGM